MHSPVQAPDAIRLTRAVYQTELVVKFRRIDAVNGLYACLGRMTQA